MSPVLVALAAKWILLGYLFVVVVAYGLIAGSEQNAPDEDKSTALGLLGYALIWPALLVIVLVGWAE